MKCYKGFDKDLKCKGFQYEVGKEYTEENADICNCGFHACESPLDVFGYYPPGAQSRYCEVELDANDQTSDNSKRVGKHIKIGAEIGIAGLVKAHFEYVNKRVKESIEKVIQSSHRRELWSSHRRVPWSSHRRVPWSSHITRHIYCRRKWYCCCKGKWRTCQGRNWSNSGNRRRGRW